MHHHPDAGIVRRDRRRHPTHSLALVVALVAGLVFGAPAVQASTTEASVASAIAKRIDRDRTSRGLPSYGVDAQLTSIARERAKAMADSRTLSHSVGGNLKNQLDSAGIAWRSYGEAIGYTTSPWGPDVADALYALWKSSATHWALITSRDFNRIGVGVARASDGATYAAIVFIDSPHGSGVPATPRPTPKPTPRPTPRPAAQATPRPTARSTPAPAPARAVEVAGIAGHGSAVRLVDPWRLVGAPNFGRPDGADRAADGTDAASTIGAIIAAIIETAVAWLTGIMRGPAGP